MKKSLLMFLTALLVFTAACAGDVERSTITVTTTPTNASTTTTVQATTTATTPAAFIEIPQNIEPVGTSLIADGYPTDNAYHAETDYSYMGGNEVVFAAEAEKYYFFAGRFLMYADSNTMETGFLCNKEDCQHAEAISEYDKKQCEAYFPSGYIKKLYYQNGRLYLTHNSDAQDQYILTSMEGDGTDRRVELQLAAGQDAGVPYLNVLHRGRFYYVWRTVDSEGSFVNTLWSYPLDTPDAKPELLYQAQNSLKNINSLIDLDAYGNCLRVQERLAVETYATSTSSSSIGFCIELVLDLTSGEWTVQQVPEGYSFRTSKMIDGILYTKYTSFESLKAEAEAELNSQLTGQDQEIPQLEHLQYRHDLESGAYEEVSDVSGDSPRWTYLFDEAYGYRYDPSESILYICDIDGAPIAQLPFKDAFEDSSPRNGETVKATLDYRYCTTYPQFGNKVILKIEQRLESSGGTSDQKMIFCYIDHSDIIRGEIQLHEFLCADSLKYNI